MKDLDENYIVDEQYKQKAFAKLSSEAWEDLVTEFEKIKTILKLRNKLQNALREARKVHQEKHKK